VSGIYLYGYNNTSAVTYADTYWNTDITDDPVPIMILNLASWNPSWDNTYKTYQDGVTDCTNFVSQAVFEGVSYTASDRNYFYPDYTHYNDWWYYKFSYEADGSLPWINVGEFYQFLTENYFNYINWGIAVRGPAGYRINLCNIHVGDLVFMYENGTGWKHSVIVDQVGTNTCNGNNVYVAAHSTDHFHHPLSEYSGFIWYPVEIIGYFNDLYSNETSLTS